jgi:CAAX prenyl protease-like protein
MLRIDFKKVCLMFLLTALLMVSSWGSPLFAISKGGCFGAAAVELFVPGLGYAITRQWDKAAVFGGGRLYSSYRYSEAVSSEYYQEDYDQIYETTDAEDSESGKTETRVTLTKETWEAQYFANLNQNLLFISWGDMYQYSCQENKETYSLMLSPFRFDHFYTKWQFWLPVVVALSNWAVFDEHSQVEYVLERGLTRDDLNRDSFSEYYMVGAGEEMFFRGVVQHYFFESFRDSWEFSPWASRHLSILGASAVFALAHSGSGFSASPGTAFLFGLYEGYAYHPSLDEFDLITAIAIHSWWDIIVSYTILNHAEFKESQADIRVPVARIGFRF